MKISYMLARENFYKIITQTVNNYNSSSDDTQKETFLVFPHLNAIVKDFKSKKIKDYIRTEYSVKGSFIKRLLVKLYVEIVFLFPMIFKAKKLEFTFKGNERADILIYPCNQRIRVFYFEEDVVDVIVKHGFNPASSQNEIDFRGKYSLEFVPSILCVENNYYREQIIDGTPLPRILNKQVKEKAIEQVKSNILNFDLENLNYISPKEYLIGIREFILNKVEVFKDDTLVNKINTLFKHRFDLDSLVNSNYNIPLVVSHGDLQLGNVWLENKTNRVLVFDWESADKRSIWYDLYFLDAAKRDEIVFNTEMLIGKTGISDNQFSVPLSVIANIISIENIHYYISSLSNLPPEISKIEIKAFIEKLNV